MRTRLAPGQFYEHANGEVYEVVNASKSGVTFETTDGEVIHMKVDEVVEDIATGVLALQEDADEGEAVGSVH